MWLHGFRPGPDPVFNTKDLPKQPLKELIRVKSGTSLLVSDLSDAGPCAVYGGNGINGFHIKSMFSEPKIVIGRVGAYCGAIHISRKNSWVTDNALYVSEMSKDLDLHYLSRALTLANFNQYAGRAAQPLVSGSRIYPVEILVPPLSDQKEYASRILCVENAATLQHSSQQMFENLYSSIQHRAFRGEL